MMKKLTILICISFLSGCATAVPMAELEAEALRSGDWSEVEKRERLVAKRKRGQYKRCPGNATNLCVARGGDMVCQCADRNSIRGMLSGRPW